MSEEVTKLRFMRDVPPFGRAYYRLLEENNQLTIAEVELMSDAELRAIPGIGARGVYEIRKAMYELVGGRPTHVCWEYQAIYSPPGRPDFLAQLNDLGLTGWEAVSSCSGGTMILLKREKRE